MISDVQPIQDHKSQILLFWNRSQQYAAKTKEQALEAIVAAWECGQHLNAQKDALPHGTWLPWLEENCPEICERTARKYMALNKSASCADLKSHKNLDAVYRHVGILPEKAEPTEKAESSRECIYLTWIQNTTQYFNAHSDSIAKLNAHGRIVLKERLKPLHDLYESL